LSKHVHFVAGMDNRAISMFQFLLLMLNVRTVLDVEVPDINDLNVVVVKIKRCK
jgi:hypothetical protein